MTRRTERIRLFAREYLIDMNATRAATVAGYSAKTAYSAGWRLLKDVEVQKLLAVGQEKRLAKLDISAERVLQELAKLAYLDPRKFFHDDGRAKLISELDDDTAAALAGIEIYEEYSGKGSDRELAGFTKKFKFTDKGINLERLGRHLGLFKDAGTAAIGGIRIVVEHIGTTDTVST